MAKRKNIKVGDDWMKKSIMLEENWGVMNFKSTLRKTEGNIQVEALTLDLIYKGNGYHIKKEIKDMKEETLCNWYYDWLLNRVDAEDFTNIYLKIKNILHLFLTNQSTVFITEKIKNLKEVFLEHTAKLCKKTGFPREVVIDFLLENEKDICINIRN